MNVFPFVVMIMTLLALFSSSSLERYVRVRKKQQVYQAYFIKLRYDQNKRQDSSFSGSAKKKPSSKSNKTFDRLKTIKGKVKKEYLNLYSLTLDTQEGSALKEVAIAYIERLYKHAEFFPKEARFAERLLDVLIANYKEASSSSNKIKLHKIKLKDPFKFPFYTMLKGTQDYSLKLKGTDKGYPPFGKVFIFNRNRKLPLPLKYASIPFLAVVLGERNTQKILEKELKDSMLITDRAALIKLLGNSLVDLRKLDLLCGKGGAP